MTIDARSPEEIPESVESWHFLPDDGRLRYGDRQFVQVGITYRIEGSIALCGQGFHGSRRAIDALEYAPGALCCRVVIDGNIVEDTDKLVGQTRTVLWMADATRILHEFACDIAESALEKHNVQDPRSYFAIQTKRLWLDEKATDYELDVARFAATDAATAISHVVAWDAARAAVHAAVRVAAWDGAKNAASAMARAGETTAGWDAALAAANEDLEARLFALVDSV